MLLGLDVDLVGLPTTPLQMLVVALILAAVAGLVLMVLTVLATPIVDRRWPADEALNPLEMLWAESGGYIRRHFPGLDTEVGKDINAQFTEVKVLAGTDVIEQGEPSTHFYVLKDGECEVLQRGADGNERIIRTHVPGDTFGELGILRRSPRTATIRAVTDSVVLQLPADEFVAGVAFSAAEGNTLLSTVNRYLAEDAARAARANVVPEAPAAPVAAETATLERADTTSDLTGEGAGEFAPTHRVPAAGMAAWVEPDAAAAPIASLGAGTELRMIGETGAWARVVAANGWEGWVDGRLLVPR